MNETPHSAESFHPSSQWRFHAALQANKKDSVMKSTSVRPASADPSSGGGGGRDPLCCDINADFKIPAAFVYRWSQVSVWGFAVLLEKRKMMVHLFSFVEKADGSVGSLPAFTTRCQALRRFRVYPHPIKLRAALFHG